MLRISVEPHNPATTPDKQVHGGVVLSFPYRGSSGPSPTPPICPVPPKAAKDPLGHWGISMEYPLLHAVVGGGTGAIAQQAGHLPCTHLSSLDPSHPYMSSDPDHKWSLSTK